MGLNQAQRTLAALIAMSLAGSIAAAVLKSGEDDGPPTARPTDSPTATFSPQTPGPATPTPTDTVGEQPPSPDPSVEPTQTDKQRKDEVEPLPRTGAAGTGSGFDLLLAGGAIALGARRGTGRIGRGRLLSFAGGARERSRCRRP